VPTAAGLGVSCLWELGQSLDSPHRTAVLGRSATESVSDAKTQGNLGTLQYGVKLHSLLQLLIQHFRAETEPEYGRDDSMADRHLTYSVAMMAGP
jgi:hypothetical protein